jgi:hypothetical protein
MLELKPPIKKMYGSIFINGTFQVPDGMLDDFYPRADVFNRRIDVFHRTLDVVDGRLVLKQAKRDEKERSQMKKKQSRQGGISVLAYYPG